jgi:hypothetical protein
LSIAASYVIARIALLRQQDPEIGLVVMRAENDGAITGTFWGTFLPIAILPIAHYTPDE